MKLSEEVRKWVNGGPSVAIFETWPDRIEQLEQQLADYHNDLEVEVAEGLETAQRNIKLRDENQRLKEATIDFIDQMRVQGLEGNLLPAEYDTLVDVVKDYRVDIDET